LKPLWAVVFGLGALASLTLSFRRSKKYILSFLAFLFSVSFLILPDLFGLEDQLLLFGQGLSAWAAAFFALMGLLLGFREAASKEEKVVVEAAPLAEFLGSLKEFLIHPYTLVEVFNLSLREACRLWGLPAGAVFLYHSGTDELILAAHVGLSREQEKKWEKIRAKEELFSRSVKTGMSLVMGDLAHSRKTWAALAPFVNFGSLVSLPLVGRERIFVLINRAQASLYFVPINLHPRGCDDLDGSIGNARTNPVSRNQCYLVHSLPSDEILRQGLHTKVRKAAWRFNADDRVAG